MTSVPPGRKRTEQASARFDDYALALQATQDKRTRLLHSSWISLVLIAICWIVPGPASPLLLGTAGLSVAVMFSLAAHVSSSTPDKGVWINSCSVLALYLACLLNVGVPSGHTYRLEALLLGLVMLASAMVLSFVSWRLVVAESARLRKEQAVLLASILESTETDD